MRSPYSNDESLAILAIPDPSRTIRNLPALNTAATLWRFDGDDQVLQNHYGYDLIGRLTSIEQSDVDGGQGVLPKLVEFNYNLAGQLAVLDRYSDLAGQQLVVSGSYEYDLAGWLKQSVNDPSAANTITQSWNYDDGHRLTDCSHSLDSTVYYDYDFTDQLTDDDAHNYDYDLAGNRETLDSLRSCFKTGC
jgi:hypothetical protein